MKKVKVEPQYESLLLEGTLHHHKNEIAILAKVFQYYGFPDVYHILENLNGNSCPGENPSWWELIGMAEKFGFQGKGIKLTVDKLQTLREFTPLITLFSFPQLGVATILIYKITADHIYFIHNNTRDGHKLSIEEFNSNWHRELVLVLLPNSDAFQGEQTKQLMQKYSISNSERGAIKIDKKKVEGILASKSVPLYYPQLLDVVIVGGGPGGVYCAAQAKLKKLRFKILEKEKNLNSYRDFPVNMKFVGGNLIRHGMLSEHLIPPPRLLTTPYIEYFERIIKEYQLQINEGEAVENVKKEHGVFFVQTSKHIYVASSVILASGFYNNRRQLKVDGYNLPNVLTDFSNVYKNAEKFKDKTTVIIGFGISAITLAEQLYKNGAKVIILYRGDQRRLKSLKVGSSKDKVDKTILMNVYQIIKRGEMQFLSNVNLKAITPGGVEFERQNELHTLVCDYVFPMIGFNPEMGHFKNTNLMVTKNCPIPVFDPRTMESSVDNLFLCGTVAGNASLDMMFHQSKKIIEVIFDRLN